MKKILKKYRQSNDHLVMTGRHIHFLRIGAFASGGINFNEEESAHFDVCRVCRLDVIQALKKLAEGFPRLRQHYAESCLNTGSHVGFIRCRGRRRTRPATLTLPAFF